MTENKRYVRILDHSEKEVRIFDENNQKNIFNIFFMGLDSAICLNGALEDTVDLLNEQHETITKQQERIHSLMKYNLECDDKVKETLQSFSNRDLLDIERIFLNNLCDELGVDLE
jgi:hypothetical protein